jgi:hypothetical protein
MQVMGSAIPWAVYVGRYCIPTDSFWLVSGFSRVLAGTDGGCSSFLPVRIHMVTDCVPALAIFAFAGFFPQCLCAGASCRDFILHLFVCGKPGQGCRHQTYDQPCACLYRTVPITSAGPEICLAKSQHFPPS